MNRKGELTFLALLGLLLVLAACSSDTAPALTLTAPAPSLAATSAATVTPASTSAPIASINTPRPSVTPMRTPRHPAIDTPAWFRDTVLYEIFPRSFYDSNGDGIGDLRGITAKLDYLQGLGIGAIWLTPIFASPSYHGYDITDYYKVNPDFGTEADLTNLVQEAHKRHIRVLLDYVVAHTSNQHPFFKDAYGNPASKYSNWYRWSNAQHTQYETFAASLEMPQLNQEDPDVQKYLIDVAKYWMTKTGNGDPRQGIDGYRCDYVINVPHDFWKKLRAEIKGINPDALLLAEAWTGMLQIAPYYDDEFDATFDFPVYGEIEGANDQAGDSMLLGGKNPTLLEGDLNAEPVLFPPGAERVVFLNNHDTDRVMSEVKGDAARARLGALLLLTQSGTPMIYYGEEIGMSGEKSPSPIYDETLREPMDWYTAESGPGMPSWFKPVERNNKPNDGVSVQEEDGKAGSLLEFYGQLVKLRDENPALRTGVREGIRMDNPAAYAYLRRDSGSAFVVVLNFGSQPVSLTLDLGPTTLPDGQYKAVDVLTGKEYPVQGLTIQADLAAAAGALLQLSPK